MYKSILQFGETGIERIENAGADFFENPADINSLVKAIQTEVLKLGAGIVSVLDEHHINKYLVSMTSHLYDSAEDGRDLLRKVIRNGTKEEFRETVEIMLGYAEEEKTEKRINESARFILSNWTAAKIRLRKSNGVVGSSTEGHVSHVLASRMSSRPPYGTLSNFFAILQLFGAIIIINI